MVADDSGEESAAEERSADLGVGLICAVNGPEIGLVFGNASAIVDDVSGDEDVVGFLLKHLVGNFTLADGIGGAITEDYKMRSRFFGFAGKGGSFEDDFPRGRDAIGEGFAGLEFGEGGGIDAVGRGARDIDAAQHGRSGTDPFFRGFVFDGPGNVPVVADPHEIETLGRKLGTVAELEVGFFEEVGVFSIKGKTEEEEA